MQELSPQSQNLMTAIIVDSEERHKLHSVLLLMIAYYQLAFLKTDAYLSWIIELRVIIPKHTNSYIPQRCDVPDSSRDTKGL